MTGGDGTDVLSLAAGNLPATVSAGSGISGFEVILIRWRHDDSNMSGLGTNAIDTVNLGAGAGTALYKRLQLPLEPDTDTAGALAGGASSA